MGEAASQIENYIDSKREDLGSNIQELEQKVKSITNWREQFQKNPMTMVGVAFGGGVLLATMLKGRAQQPGVVLGSNVPHSGTDKQSRQALETWDNIKGALIGVAATRFKDFIGEVIPGFEEQFSKTEIIKSPPPSTVVE